MLTKAEVQALQPGSTIYLPTKGESSSFDKVVPVEVLAVVNDIVAYVFEGKPCVHSPSMLFAAEATALKFVIADAEIARSTYRDRIADLDVTIASAEAKLRRLGVKHAD